MATMSVRDRVLQEILSTETTYVEDLERLNIFFLAPLRKLAGTPGEVLPAAQVNTIFGTVDQLLTFNKSFLKDLEGEIGASSSGSGEVGRLFVAFGPYLKMYSAYVDKHDVALKALEEAETQCQPFRSFLTNIYALNTVRSQTLRSFLIMPVQRVPRYRLLLKELLKQTPESHPDREELRAALRKVEEAATHINEGIRRRENLEKILEIQTDEGVELMIPGRVFLKEGTLSKLCRRGFKPFSFYLFNDIVLYCGAAQFGRSSRILQLSGVVIPEDGGVAGTSVKRSPRGSFWLGGGGGGVPPPASAGVPLGKQSSVEFGREAGDRPTGATAPVGADDEDGEGGVARPRAGSAGTGATKDLDPTRAFLLQSSTKSFIVQAESEAEAVEWRSALRGAAKQSRVRAGQRGGGGGSATVGVSAPVWEVDSDVPTCRQCTVKFSLLVRKHHCRSCGSIVCQPCSPYRWPLPHLDPDKPSRVCTGCYSQLTGAGEVAVPAAGPTAPPGPSIVSSMAKSVRRSITGLASRLSSGSGGSAPGGPPASPTPADDYIPSRRRSVPHRKPSTTPSGNLEAAADEAVDSLAAAKRAVAAVAAAEAAGVSPLPPPVPARASVTSRPRRDSYHRTEHVPFEAVKGRASAAPPVPIRPSAAPVRATPPPVPTPPVPVTPPPTGELPGAPRPNTFADKRPPVRPSDAPVLPASFLHACVVAGDFDVSGLPDNWFAAGDAGSGKVYYFNDVTEQTAWEPPPGSDPTLVATTVVQLPPDWEPVRSDEGHLYFVTSVGVAPPGYDGEAWLSQWGLPVGSLKLRPHQSGTSSAGPPALGGGGGMAPLAEGEVEPTSRVGAVGVRILRDVSAPSSGRASFNAGGGPSAARQQGVGVAIVGSRGLDGEGYASTAPTAPAEPWNSSHTRVESNTSLAQAAAQGDGRAPGDSTPAPGTTTASFSGMLTGSGGRVPLDASGAPPVPPRRKSAVPAPAPAPSPSSGSGPAGTPPVPPRRKRLTQNTTSLNAAQVGAIRELKELEDSHTTAGGAVNIASLAARFAGSGGLGTRAARVKRSSRTGAATGAPAAAGGGGQDAPVSSRKRPSWMAARKRGVADTAAPAPAPAPAPAVSSRTARAALVASKLAAAGQERKSRGSLAPPVTARGSTKAPRRKSALPRVGEDTEEEGGAPSVAALRARFEGR